MFGTLGGPELFLIFVVALIVFGPRKLPDIGKSLGRMMSEFRRASNDFKSTIESEVESEKIKESMRIAPPKVKPVKASPPAVAAADGADHAPEADPPPGSSAPTDSPSAGDAEPATSGTAPEGTADVPTPAEPLPTTVSRQPPASSEEPK